MKSDQLRVDRDLAESQYQQIRNECTQKIDAARENFELKHKNFVLQLKEENDMAELESENVRE